MKSTFASPAGKSPPVWTLRVVLVALAILAYANSFHVPFVWDDVDTLGDRLLFEQKSFAWADFLHDPRWVTNVTFLWNYQWGDVRVEGYHAVNLAIHLAAGLVLFELVRHTLRTSRVALRYASAADLLAFATATVWLLHPLQTQAVTYIIQRYESLMGLLYLCALYGLARSATAARRWPWLAFSCAALLFGLRAKEIAVTAPVLLVWYDRVFLVATWSELWRRRWSYYLAVAAIWLACMGGPVLHVGNSLARQAVQETHGSSGTPVGAQVPIPENSTAVLVEGVTPLDYALSQPGVIWHYLRLAVWPAGLCLDCEWPVARTAVTIVPPLLALLALLILTGWASWFQPAWGFLAAAFFIILAPTSSIVPIQDLMVEHRMYLPLATMVTAVVCGGYEFLLLRQFAHSRSPGMMGPLIPRRLLVATAVVATLLLALTVQRNHDYRSRLAIWSNALAQNPANYRALYNLGLAYAAAGDAGGLEQSLDLYRRALALNPLDADSHNQLGSVLGELGQLDAAAQHLRIALEIKPQHPEANNNLGSVLAQQGQFEAALPYIQRALGVRPRFAEAWSNLGAALAALGEFEESRTAFARALEILPHDAKTRNSLGSALAQQGRLSEAIAEFRQAVEALPEFTIAWNNLGMALGEHGETAAALTANRRVLELEPDFVPANVRIARILATHPDARFRNGDSAVRVAEEACRQTGMSDPLCLDVLAAALAEAGRMPQAVATAEHARKLALAADAAPLAEAIESRARLYRRGEPYRRPGGNW